MAVTFETETGSGSATANSYASTANGDDYHEKHLYGTSWTGASAANKQAALMMATRLLDENVSWYGTTYKDTQALQWPRIGTRARNGWAIDHDEIPADLINATCELARLLIAQDRTAEADTKGFDRIKVGSIDLGIDKADRIDVMTPTIRRMVEPLGRPVGGGMRKLVRA